MSHFMSGFSNDAEFLCTYIFNLYICHCFAAEFNALLYLDLACLSSTKINRMFKQIGTIPMKKNHRKERQINQHQGIIMMFSIVLGNAIYLTFYHKTLLKRDKLNLLTATIQNR